MANFKPVKKWTDQSAYNGSDWLSEARPLIGHKLDTGWQGRLVKKTVSNWSTQKLGTKHQSCLVDVNEELTPVFVMIWIWIYFIQ